MNVLIVDDQINVVSGVLFGVHWDRLGIEQVYKAYNAYEARQVLKERQVDIMLCDIEMPVENGLSLLAWCREQGMDTETIFLTAHADFMYAKEAVALGSLDYILQPARYEEIEDAVKRAMEKIRLRRRMDENSQFGEFLRKKKGIVLGAILADLFTGDGKTMGEAVKNLEELGICLGGEARLCVLNAVRFGKGLEKWDSTLLYDTISNVLDELFYPYAWKTLTYQVNKSFYYVILYNDGAARLNDESFQGQLGRFRDTFSHFFDSDFALYYAEMDHMEMLPELMKLLKKADQDNVERKAGVYSEQVQSREAGEAEEHFCENWETLLENELYDAVVQDALKTLDSLSVEKRLNSRSLRRFYQKIMGVIYLMAKKHNLEMDVLFPEEGDMQRALTAYTYTQDTLWLVKYMTARFHELRSADGGKDTWIDEIYQYIRSHINEDIKRDDIADFVHLNANYISSMFKNKTGISLKEYIIAEKMSLARKLVRETQLPVSVIAMKVGYSNFSHFSQSYKKVNGVSPTEDRAEQE